MLIFVEFVSAACGDRDEAILSVQFENIRRGRFNCTRNVLFLDVNYTYFVCSSYQGSASSLLMGKSKLIKCFLFSTIRKL